MENLNGSLVFQATLDINDFNVSADAMERHIRKVSTTTQIEAADMEQSLLDFAQKGAMYIQAYLVGQGMTGLLQSIVQVRGQFQQLEIAFGTMLGSEQAAKDLMDQMIETAARTPFDLAGVAGGAKQLLAYGTAADKVNDTLVRLGNIASGLSIPLNDIVYLYGTTMVQGRLYAQDVRQFIGRGIPLVKELAKMYGVTAEEINNMVSAGKIGFPDVEKVINSLTNEGGQFYNLMEKQSASLTGMISNLEDAWDGMLNDIGTSNQDVFAGAISSATYLVENYQKILDILEAIVISYGSYKAAIVLNTLATKGYTGVALIDNTVRQAKIGLMKAEAVATGQVAAQTKAMQAAQEAHVATLEREMTAEELANLKKQLRIATIQSLLTAQQAEYLSNLGLTASSEGYEAAALQVMTVEQQQAVQKLDLTSKSAIYRAALEQEVAAKRGNAQAAKEQAAAELEAMRVEVSASAKRMESAKQAAIVAMQKVEAARYELYWTRQNGDATAIATAQKKLEGAQDNMAISRKAALAASTDFYNKKKALEVAATRQSIVASTQDATAKGVQTAATNILSAATNKATMALRALWATMKANPIGWLVTIIGMAVSAVTLFSDKEEEITEATGTLSNATKKATKEFNDQAAKVDALRKIIDDSNISYEQRNKALVELKSIVPGYNALLTQEGKIINNNTEAINKYLVALEKQIKLKAAQEELEEAYKKKRALVKTEREQSDKYWSTRQANTAQGYDRDGFIGKTLRFFGAEDETNRKKELEKTQKDLNDVNQQINSLNQEISETSVSMSSATTATKSYNEQVEETQEKIATLQKELSDMRSGSVSKDNLANAIQEKERELRAAQSDLAALTGKKTPTGGSGGSGSAANNAEQLAQKQLEAQRKLEEARIQVMEEGYAKRKAALDLQHQEALDRINKEEKELENAYKRAGKKGGLSADERAAFQERRNLEKQSYDTESTKLFDGEIEYKKRQYQAYFNWVKNVGQDVADAHFKTLIAEGSSFTAWINRQIADLEAKRATDPSTFTDGDANALNALRMQQNEINGTKSAMDLFRESVSRMVGQAQTLAEKLQAVANLKERLAKGEFHLNQDETAAASYQLNQQDSDLQREVQDKVLTEYRTYEKKKKSIQDEYALLRAEAQKMNDQERIRMINEAEAEELSNLNANMLKQSDAWKRLFTNLESLTATELAELISGMQSQLNNADLKLSPVDYKALMDSLDKAKQELISKNPFKALDQFYNDYIKAKEKLAKAKASVAAGKGSDKDVKDAQGEVKKAAKGMTDTVEQLTDTAVECGNAIASIFDSMGNDELADGLGNAVEMMGALGDAAASYGKIMSGDIMGGISGMAQSISSIVGIFTKMHDAKYEKRIEQLQNDIDALEISYTRLERAFNNTYWVFDENQKAGYEQNIELIKQQIKALEAEAEAARKLWRFGEYSRINKEIKELQQTLQNSKESGDTFSIYEAQKENLRQQQEDIRQQIEAEKDKKKTDNDRIKQWEEQIEQITMQIEDLDRSMQETLAGTTVKNAIDEFADALTEAFAQGEDAAEALGKKTKEVLKNAVVEALKRQFLAKGINDAVAYLGDAMKDNVLSDNERATFEAMVNHAGDLYRNAMDGVADLIKDVEDDTNVDALTGAVQGMSEETGGLVAGRLNAVIINQGEQVAMLRQLLLYQAAIEANTGSTVAELKEIKAMVNRLANSENPLLAQGIV